MTELYSRERLMSLRSKGKRHICVATCALAVSLLICVALCFFVNDTNAVFLRTLCIIISGGGGCVALYWLFDRILPTLRRKTYVERLLFLSGQMVTGLVEDTGRSCTLSRGILAKELRVTDDEGQVLLLYWDLEAQFPELNGRRAMLRAVQNRIVAYEVME